MRSLGMFTARAFWIDYSGPGESARYAANAEDDLRTGRADARPLPVAPRLESDDEGPAAWTDAPEAAAGDEPTLLESSAISDDDPGLAGLAPLRAR